jgi:two-component system, response regulator PdtaR
MESDIRWNFPAISIRQGYNVEKTIRILLVEDEVLPAMHIEIQLKGIGYPVFNHVTTGEDAIIIAKQDSPDIILMDIRLAGEIDGIDAAAAIKAESDIPVIFITGYDDKDIRERAEKTKPIGYLIKPLDIHSIKTILDAHFL